MGDHVLTGYAALVSALALLVHAVRAAIPGLVRAFEARADSRRIDAKARADAELAERTRADQCEERHAARDAHDKERDDRHAAEIGTLRGMCEALHDELEELRASITTGHTPRRRSP